MRNKNLLTNIDNSDLINYPNGRIKNNGGSGDGTPINEVVYGDIHEMKDELMRLAGIAYNNLPDNVANSYQLVQALSHLPTKNDFIESLTVSGTQYFVNLRLSKLKLNESFIFKSTVNKGSQTTIVGSDSTSKNITVIGDFLANEYVRAVYLGTSITLVRLVNAGNFLTVASGLGLLLKATQTQEDAGTVDTVATTPLKNKTVFELRVNGIQSDTYKATAAINGLMSKEDKVRLDSLVKTSRNGTVLFGDISGGTVGQNVVVSGDIQSATILERGNGRSVIQATLTTAMPTSDYVIQITTESLGSLEFDNDVKPPVFKRVSNQVFKIYYEETGSVTQDIRANITINQI
jgi:hypothetical protein